MLTRVGGIDRRIPGANCHHERLGFAAPSRHRSQSCCPWPRSTLKWWPRGDSASVGDRFRARWRGR